jgi:putative colanic acid biosynthesis UDP-glucose lipid carrier transferase
MRWLRERGQIAPRPLRLRYTSAKRSLDIILSLAAILICLPVFGLIAVLIRLDSPGPVLFRQRRGGFGGKPFTIIKFRTMAVLEDGPEIKQALKNDPRATRIGRLLRALFIDELPQMLNVLTGDMSLVGPRPHALTHDVYYGSRIDGYERRYAVKPGVTGWAQINGARGPTPLVADMTTRVALDLWYVDNANLALDLMILARTPLELLRRIR